MRILLDEGRFGKVHLGLAETLWYRDNAYYGQVAWRGTWETECGGVTVSQAVHLIDALVGFSASPGTYSRGLPSGRTSAWTTHLWP
jgi:predicted dehydrogenase